MKVTGAKRNVCPGSCVSTGATFPVAPVESAPMIRPALAGLCVLTTTTEAIDFIQLSTGSGAEKLTQNNFRLQTRLCTVPHTWRCQSVSREPMPNICNENDDDRSETAYLQPTSRESLQSAPNIKPRLVLGRAAKEGPECKEMYILFASYSSTILHIHDSTDEYDRPVYNYLQSTW